jgi:hypothetical protein
VEIIGVSVIEDAPPVAWLVENSKATLLPFASPSSSRSDDVQLLQSSGLLNIIGSSDVIRRRPREARNRERRPRGARGAIAVSQTSPPRRQSSRARKQRKGCRAKIYRTLGWLLFHCFCSMWAGYYFIVFAL